MIGDVYLKLKNIIETGIITFAGVYLGDQVSVNPEGFPSCCIVPKASNALGATPFISQGKSWLEEYQIDIWLDIVFQDTSANFLEHLTLTSSLRDLLWHNNLGDVVDDTEVNDTFFFMSSKSGITLRSSCTPIICRKRRVV